MRNSTSGRPLGFSGLLFFIIGVVLMLAAERPEFRARSGDGATEQGRVVATLGQGTTAVGSALLGYRAVANLRRQARLPQPGADERPPRDPSGDGGPDDGPA